MQNLLLQILQRLNNPELRLVVDVSVLFYSARVCLPDTQLIPHSTMAIRSAYKTGVKP